MLKKVSAVFLLVITLTLSMGRVFAASPASSKPSLAQLEAGAAAPVPNLVPQDSANSTATKSSGGQNGPVCTTNAAGSQGTCNSGYVCANINSNDLANNGIATGTCELSATTSAQAPSDSLDSACSKSQLYSWATYTGLVGGGFAEYVGLDALSGVASKFGVGEGLSQITDLFTRHFTRAVIWGLFATVIMWIIGPILNFALYLNTVVLDIPTVKIIYGVLLDLVNVGFVIAIIIIAFGTMFRNNKYGGTKNLTKVIAAALLINFGFFFAGVVIDAGNTVTYVFAAAATGEKYTPGSHNIPTNFGNEVALVSRYNVASITCGVNSLLSTVIQNVKQSGNINLIEKVLNTVFVTLSRPLVSVTIGAIISLVWSATLIAIAVVFLVRFAFLVFLVAIMPVSWLGLIFPSFKISIPGIKGGDAFSGWWSQFINWVVIGPMILFLLYISHLLSDALTSFSGTQNLNFAQGGSESVAVSALVIQLAAIIIVNLIGLYGAIKMSGAAGAIAMAATGTIIGRSAQMLTNVSGSLAARSKLRSEAAQKAGQESKTWLGSQTQYAKARFFGTASKTLSGVALPPQYRQVLGQGGLGKIPQTNEFNVAKSIENRKKQLDTRLPIDVVAMAKRTATLGNLARSPLESAALLSYLIDKKQLNKLNDKQIVPLLKSAASVGAQKDILSARPGLSAALANVDASPAQIGDYLKEIKKTASKMSSDKVKEASIPISPDDLKSPNKTRLMEHEAVLISLTPQQVAQKILAGTPEEQENFVKAIRAMQTRLATGGDLDTAYAGNPKLADMQNGTKDLIDYIEKGGKGKRRNPDLINIWRSYPYP